MSIEFRQLTRLVEMAWTQSPKETYNILCALHAQALGTGSNTEADIIQHAAAQLARGQPISTGIMVDGSAPAPIPVQQATSEVSAPAPAPSEAHGRSRRNRRV